MIYLSKCRMLIKMIVILFVIALCVSSPASSAVAKRNIQKRAVCGLNEHRCNDGVCVKAELVCDGHSDCADGSDEKGCRHNSMSYVITIEGPLNGSSTNVKCLKNQWQCRDGTCISFDDVCNRVLDCPDSSDEALTLCRTTQPVSSVIVATSGGRPTLQLPIQPEQVLPAVGVSQAEWPGMETVPGDFTGNLEPGSNDSENTLRSCKLVPHPSVVYRCVGTDGLARKCGYLEPAGTDVIPECSPLYYSPITLTPMRCIDGYWDYVARCTQECGRVFPGASALEETTPSDGKMLTWHVVIYRKNTQPYRRVCGGSLVSNTAIISAARCFWSEELQEAISASEFAVAVGKKYEQWDILNEEAQTSNVQKIILPPRFRGDRTNNQDDIAIIVVTDPFKYSPYVGPVCVDSNSNFDKHQLRDGNFGKTAGWWADDELPLVQVRALPYVAIETCINEIPIMYKQYITSDKICAGNQSSSTLCKKDVGSGLAFEYTSKFYLRGIVSMTLSENACNIMNFVTLTQILKHKAFIRQHWDVLNVDGSVVTTTPVIPVTKCILPPTPAHGSYTTNAALVNGDASYVLVTLTVTCHPGFGVQGPSSIKCYNGFWADKVPQCIQMCPLIPHASVEFRCLLSGEQVGLRACSDHEPPGTVVSPRCRDPHYYSTSPLPFMRCENHARWNYIARCKPDCGRATPKGQELVIGGVNAKHGELPWHAGIYDKTANPYMQVCGGSLISNNLVISAAHCFWRQRKALPESQFAVAVGKLYRPWNDPVDEAQTSDVKHIHLPLRFRGSDANFQDDIAVVVVLNAFEYRSFIRPVCLSFDANFERSQLQTINKGKVAGWGLVAANGKASPVLQVLEMPYVEVDTCIAQSPSDFVQFITSDKICAGNKQGNTTLCRGDSGGGLVFSATNNYIERYYLRGIVSTAPADANSNECNIAVFTSFTQIMQHEAFIVQYLNDF